MKQLIPFNQSKAGNKPLLCLQNTRLGYGIGAKYSTAWQAWLHTQQHPDVNYPALEVPLYYSFTHTINGVKDNYGHINVRLKDGRVWSDGKIYANLPDFESKFTNVHYVGWGESINDVDVIGYNGGDMLSEDDFYKTFRGMLGRDPTPDEAKNLSRDASVLVNTLWNNGSEQRYKDDKNPPEYVETKVFVKKEK